MLRTQIAQLVHALALQQCGSFHRAAGKLNMSQPGLSRSIALLEETIGFRLFDRSSKGALPTAMGQTFLDRARTIVDAMEDLEREAYLASGGHHGQITVGTGPFPAAISVLPALARVISDHPTLRVRILQTGWEEATNLVLRRDVDFAVADVGFAESRPGLSTRVLGQHPVSFVCRPSHPLARRVAPSLDEIFDWPVMAAQIPQRLGEAAARQLALGPGAIRPSIELDCVTQAAEVAITTDAVLTTPLVIVERELREGRLIALGTSFPWLAMRYGVIAMEGRAQSVAAQLFLDAIEAVEAETRRLEADLRSRFHPDP